MNTYTELANAITSFTSDAASVWALFLVSYTVLLFGISNSNKEKVLQQAQEKIHAFRERLILKLNNEWKNDNPYEFNLDYVIHSKNDTISLICFIEKVLNSDVLIHDGHDLGNRKNLHQTLRHLYKKIKTKSNLKKVFLIGMSAIGLNMFIPCVLPLMDKLPNYILIVVFILNSGLGFCLYKCIAKHTS